MFMLVNPRKGSGGRMKAILETEDGSIIELEVIENEKNEIYITVNGRRIVFTQSAKLA
jgi:hypothetical protein